MPSSGHFERLHNYVKERLNQKNLFPKAKLRKLQEDVIGINALSPMDSILPF